MNDLIGKIIAGRYRIESFLGKGGMAEVYKVWDQERSVYLAVKILHGDLAEDKVFLRRFKREAQTLAKLQHPNIVRFYGLEQDGDLVYMLMDYVEGTTLRKEIFQTKVPFSMERIVDVMKFVCAALNYAHKSGFVHCDVKPANIMIHKNGMVYVSDFGIARMTEASTSTMVGAGTPAYMAPEQVRGENPLPQTDIYALGVVLFEMLTGGERPFTGESAKTAGSTSEKVRWEQTRLAAPPPSKYNPSIPSDVDDIVLRCLDKSPSNRYVGVTDLLNDLAQTLSQPGAILLEPEDEMQGAQPVASTPPVHEDAPQGVGLKPAVTKGQLPETVRANSRISKIPSVFAWIIGGMAIFLLGMVFGGRFSIQPALPAPEPSAAPAASSIVSVAPEEPIIVTSTPVVTPTLASSPTPAGYNPHPETADYYDDSGAPMRLIAAGKFPMGSNISNPMAEQPIHIVFLDDYYIDKYEVTNAQYRMCAREGICRLPLDFASSTQEHYYDDKEYDNFPIIQVDWEMAKTYCEWRGAQLPTEAQWEKAVRGIDGNAYPWGNNAPKADLSNYNNIIGDTTEVGKYPVGASVYGVFDMAGNVWEWVSDWYDSGYYLNSPLSNPLGPEAGQYRQLRGGSWWSVDPRSAGRHQFKAGNRLDDIGFRCVLSLP